MPLNHNQYSCDTTIKTIASKYSHRKCSCKKNRILATKITGKRINDWLVTCRQVATNNGSDNDITDVVLLPTRKQYYICYNLKKMVDRSMDKKGEEDCSNNTTNTTTSTSNTKVVTHRNKSTAPKVSSSESLPMSRAARLKKRNGANIKDVNLPGIKVVRVVVEGDEDEVIPLKKIRISNKELFHNDVMNNYYKVPFGKLTMKQRRRRMGDISKIVLGACIDRKEYKAKKENYLLANKELGIDILNLLDGMKEYIEKRLDIQFKHIEDSVIVPIENDDEGLITDLDKKKKEHALAIALLGETSANGYTRMKKKMKEYTSLPSYHILCKNRPTIEAITFDVMDSYDHSNSEVIISETNLDATIESIHHNTILSEINTGNEETDLAVVLRALSQPNKDTLNGARIKGDYKVYIEMMEKNMRVKKEQLEMMNK